MTNKRNFKNKEKANEFWVSLCNQGYMTSISKTRTGWVVKW
jgi:hypothetical protein